MGGPVATTASERREFGVAPFAEGSLLVEHVSIDGRWLSVCRARPDTNANNRPVIASPAHGEQVVDDLVRYLITPGEELPLDAVMGADPTGRFVLLKRGDSLFSWDNQRRTSLDLSALGADTRLSAESFAELRSAAFDTVGQHLLYLRAGDTGARVVLHDLNDDSERTFDPGPGPIWRAHLDPGGAFVVLDMLTEDSNGNGRLDFPAPMLSGPRPCGAGPPRYHAWVDRGDRAETVLVRLDTGISIRERDLIYPVGDALLERDAAGALIWERAGKKRVLEPASCKGRVVHADALRQLFVIGCAQKKTGRVSLELVTISGRKPLGLELASVELDREPEEPQRLVALYPGADTMLLDADKLAILPLKAGDSVLAMLAGRALIRRGNALLIFDADTLSEQQLPGTLDKFPEVLLSGPYAFVSPLLVDLYAGQVVGGSHERPIALSNTGQLLLSDGEPDAAGRLGAPLHWLPL